jgi:diguanylate cyclase (GGDEF)-like protein
MEAAPGQVDEPAAAALPFAGSADEVIDPSTGLFSRPQFDAMFSKEFKRAARFKQQMSCMLIDLDGSAMGRKADESLVKALIGVVQNTIREVDTAAWWSGGALIVLLPNTMRNDAVQAGMRILEAMAVHPVTWPDAARITVSIGVAGLPDRKIDSEKKMIDAAVAACRRARETMRRQSNPPEGGGTT